MMSSKVMIKIILKYFIAIIAVIFAVLLRIELIPYIGDTTRYLTVFPTLMLIAFFLGIGPSLVACVLAVNLVQIWHASSESLWFLDHDKVFEASFVIITGVATSIAVTFIENRRRSFEADLRKTKEDLNRAQTVALTGSWRLDLRKNELSWSDETYHIFGISKDTAVTYESFLTAILSEDRDYVEKSWKAALTGEPYDIKHRILVDGQIKWVREKAELEFNKKGELLSGFGVVQDITALKMALDELEIAKNEAETASKAKSDFLSMMSHEIRTPLNVITGFSELLIKNEKFYGFSDECKEYVNHIRNAGKLLASLINNILDISKIEAGKVEVDLAEVSLIGLFNEIESLMNPLAIIKGISLKFKIPEFLPHTIKTDPLKFRQILINIISNAIKFTAKGFVEVDVFMKSSNILNILVKDTGIGITIQQAQNLFKPFVQGDKYTSRRFGGTGLGLALSRNLTRLLGGEIVLEESFINEGSVFKISLPLDIVESKVAEKAPKHDETVNRLDGIRVLLAEDTKEIQILMKKYLDIAGANIEIASDGYEAIEKAMTNTHDIVLMDLQMPHLNGFEATSKLRENGYTKPIVALTASSTKEDMLMALSVGCSDYMAKPANMSPLISIIDRLTRA